MSGNARRSTAHTCLSACAPVASIGTGAWNSTFGSTTSSIVFEMTSASPVFTASWKQTNLALLLVVWAVDMWLLLGSKETFGWLPLLTAADLTAGLRQPVRVISGGRP